MPQRTCGVTGCPKPHRARGFCSTHYNQQHQPGRHCKGVTPCSVCQEPISRPVSTSRRPVCSVACRSALSGHDGSIGTYSWARDAAQRARNAGATVVDLFDREHIFERDRWACQQCGITVSLDVDALDPTSATVDHVIPLSQGGEHTMTNTQCLCLLCNSIKSDRAAVTLSS